MLRNGSPATSQESTSFRSGDPEFRDSERHPPGNGPGSDIPIWDWLDKGADTVRLLPGAELEGHDVPAPRPARGPGRTSSSKATAEPREAKAPASQRSATSSRVPRKFEWLEALRGRSNLSNAAYRVLVNLATYADANLSGARPGNARLASDCGYTGAHTGKTVGKVVQRLIDKGYAVVLRRGTNSRGNLAATYRVTLPEWEA